MKAKTKLVAAIAAVSLAATCVSGCDKNSSIGSDEPQSNPDRFVSDGPICYVITDTDTGVQYLFAKGNVGNGGLTVLVDEDGKPMTAKSEADDD